MTRLPETDGPTADSSSSEGSPGDSQPARNGRLHLALPKGRMYDGVAELLKDAGIEVHASARGYRPCVSLDACEVKILKPQNIVEMLHVGSRDVGFTGADWVAELDAEAVEVLDTGLDPVRIVAAAPTELLDGGELPDRQLVIASEYERVTRSWIASRHLDATFIHSYGATEVFPPEDADVIVDNTATGSTLAANGLEIVDEVMRSSTRLYASPRALDDPAKRQRIEDLKLLLSSVIEARRRVMVEVNAPADRLEAVVAILPCMREATVSPLYGESGFAVKAAVPRDRLPEVIPAIKAAGGSDVVVTRVGQIVP
jgi:ATP phosphoribosyltransferase